MFGSGDDCIKSTCSRAKGKVQHNVITARQGKHLVISLYAKLVSLCSVCDPNSQGAMILEEGEQLFGVL